MGLPHPTSPEDGGEVLSVLPTSMILSRVTPRHHGI
jgi:hypothetical protein